MDNKYNRHNRRKYSLKVHIVSVTKYRKQLLGSNIADDVKRNTSFDPMIILLVVLGKYRHLQFKSTSKTKGSGFPSMTTERILFMKTPVND